MPGIAGGREGSFVPGRLGRPAGWYGDGVWPAHDLLAEQAGDRRCGQVIRLAAVTQVRYQYSDGRARFEKKLAEGQTPE